MSKIIKSDLTTNEITDFYFNQFLYDFKKINILVAILESYNKFERIICDKYNHCINVILNKRNFYITIAIIPNTYGYYWCIHDENKILIKAERNVTVKKFAKMISSFIRTKEKRTISVIK